VKTVTFCTQRCPSLWSIALLVIVLLSGCTQSTLSQATPTAHPFPSHAPPSPIPALALSPTPNDTYTPTPVASFLAALPTNCPVKQPPHMMTLSQTIHVPAESGVYPAGTPLYGTSPIWLTSNYETLHLNQEGYTPWPLLKLQFLIEPQFASSVTVQISDMMTGKAVWFNLSGSFPPDSASQFTSVDVFDLRGASTTGWKDSKAFPFMSQAGCYRMTVQWPEGSWMLIFAAGK